jgi:hypothetical protein
MRNGQGMPVNVIVLTALALLVLVVVGAFFISGFGQATAGITVVERDQAQCSSICQGLAASAFNYDDCSQLKLTERATDYMGAVGSGCDFDYGTCTVTLRGGNNCFITNEI